MNKKLNTSASTIDKYLSRIPSLTRRRVRKKMELAVHIKDILESKGWTQRDLAVKLGKRESEISRLLAGDHNMTLDTIFKLEEVLGTDIIQVAKQTQVASYSQPIESSDRFGTWVANEPEPERPYGKRKPNKKE